MKSFKEFINESDNMSDAEYRGYLARGLKKSKRSTNVWAVRDNLKTLSNRLLDTNYGSIDQDTAEQIAADLIKRLADRSQFSDDDLEFIESHI